MKFIHISDLHLGKVMNGFSMIDQGDQKYWMEQLLKVVDEKKVDAVVIAGDVYDRSIAPKEAIHLFNEFVSNLHKRGIYVMAIAGNHDSGVRLAGPSEVLMASGVHLAGEIKKDIHKVVLKDNYGDVNFYLVPYVFPSAVESVLGVEHISDYGEAFKMLLDAQDINFEERNVIVSHQNVTVSGNEPERGGSEDMIGGVGGIDVSVYDGFDYVALGHIHAAQRVGKNTIRYAGSPLCYHFDEVKHSNKGPIVVELNEKGNITVETVRIEPLHQLREVQGTLTEIVASEKEMPNRNEYIKVVLTDDFVPVGAVATIENTFASKDSTVFEILHRPARTFEYKGSEDSSTQELSLEESFAEFFKEKNSNREYPDDTQRKIVQKVCEQIVNGEFEKADRVSEKDTEELIKYVLGLED